MGEEEEEIDKMTIKQLLNKAKELGVNTNQVIEKEELRQAVLMAVFKNDMQQEGGETEDETEIGDLEPEDSASPVRKGTATSKSKPGPKQQGGGKVKEEKKEKKSVKDEERRKERLPKSNSTSSEEDENEEDDEEEDEDEFRRKAQRVREASERHKQRMRVCRG